MKVPIQYQYEIMSNGNKQLSEWKYWDIELNWLEGIVYKWAERKKVYPSDISFLDRTLRRWENRIKRHEAELFSESNEENSSSDCKYLFVDFCDPNPEYRQNGKLFPSVHAPDVDRQIRAIAMMDIEEH